MTQWLDSYLHSLGNRGFVDVLIFVFSFAGLSMLGVPLIPFAIAGGLLFGIAGGLAGVIAGSTLGATMGFLFSRYIAREKVAKYLSKNPKFVMIDNAIHAGGWKIVMLLRMCPLPYGLSNYAYGLTKISLNHYLIATIIGMLPGEIVFVCMGAAGKQLSDLNGSPATKALTGLGIAALIGVLFLIRKMVMAQVQQTQEHPLPSCEQE